MPAAAFRSAGKPAKQSAPLVLPQSSDAACLIDVEAVRAAAFVMPYFVSSASNLRIFIFIG
jgi:hypothetical protein